MLDFLLSAPVLVKVLVALALILVFNRICGQLFVSVAMGTLVLAAWSGHSPAAMGRIAWGRIWSLDNTLLLIVIFQVIALSSQMAETGVMGDLLTAVRGLVSRRAAMAVLPALIGLLPMPGGALFSAPLVDNCDPDGSLPAQLKALTNHWFRHIWEYWWPLYPGVLLAMQITELEVWQFMLLGIPLTLCALVAGRIFLLHRIPPDEEPPRGRSVGTVHRVLVLLMPIIVVIGSYGLIRGLYPGFRHVWPALPADMNRYVPMLVGLVGAMLVLQIQRPLGRAQWKRVLLSRQALNMVILVTMVRVYGAFIEAELPDGTALVAQMHDEMADWGIPVIAITMLLPLIAGLATGLSIGFVGASFPIVMSLVGDSPDAGVRMATAVLAYGFGYVGQLLSPVHVCLVVTSEFFKTPVLGSAARLLKPVTVILSGALLMHFLLGLF